MPIDLNDTEPQFVPYDIEDLNARLADRAADWIPQSFPRGRITNGTLRLANISGDPPRKEGSCVIELKGAKAADWYDHTTRKGGSPLDTLSHATGLVGRELFQKATDIVGTTRSRGRPRKANGHADHADHTVESTVIWNGATAPQGTLTEVYLASRGLRLPPTEDLRHGEITDYANKILRPAMIARVRRADTGEPTGGIHRTFLTEDGQAAREEMRGKHKLTLGPIEGGVVMLAPMSADGELGVAEGLETARAVTEIDRRRRSDPPDPLPVWATLGTAGMMNMPFPPGLKTLLIFADAGKAGLAVAEKLQARALAVGIDAQYYVPRSGDDFARDLELRLWETNPGDCPPARSPEELDRHPEKPSESANLSPESVDRQSVDHVNQAPAWNVSAGPTPPQTVEAIAAACQALTPETYTTEQVAFILRGIAIARLDPLDERQSLSLLKRQTKFPIDALRKMLKAFQREIGLATSGRSLQPWASKLIINENGSPAAIPANAVMVLSEDEAFKGAIRFDKLRTQTMLAASVPWDQHPTVPRPWRDQDDRECQVWLQQNDIIVTLEVARDAVQTVAERDPYHPVMDYLHKCRWDGVPRLDTWLITYLGAEDNEYTRAVGPRWMISGVARVYEPGCKVDTALILEGPQGTLKSTVFDKLGGPFYSNDIAALGTKDAQEQLLGLWVLELDELEAVTRAADVASVKSFVSRRIDRFRHSYGRRVEIHPRQCIFGGTVNKDTWQRDETGGRRWWPVKCGLILIDDLEADRDQLWAEARDRYLSEEKWWLEVPELVEAARVEQEKRFEPDVWEEKVAAYVSVLPDTRIDDILGERCLNIPVDRWSKSDQIRVGAILRHLGWIRKFCRLYGQPASVMPRWRWLKPETK